MLSPADEADLPEVVALMNLAFRGVGADAGWNSEDYIDGERTTEPLLRADLAAKPDTALLLWREADGGAIQGSVLLEPEGDAWFLGSLTVDPRRQDQGLGRQLLAAAEAWAVERGAREIRMTVVNVRETLIAWYLRRGYTPTGETLPFPYGDTRYGVPRRGDLAFVVLSKMVGG